MFVPFGITSLRPSAVVNERFVIVDVWLTLMVVAAPHDWSDAVAVPVMSMLPLIVPPDALQLLNVSVAPARPAAAFVRQASVAVFSVTVTWPGQICSPRASARIAAASPEPVVVAAAPA